MGVDGEKRYNETELLPHYWFKVDLIRRDELGGATPIAARESVVRYQMTLREGAFTDLRSLRVFLGTYNVNGQAPTSGLADWLAIDAEPPDVVAVGFQELDLSKEAFLFNETPREDEWQRAVMRALHPRAKYRKVGFLFGLSCYAVFHTRFPPLL